MRATFTLDQNFNNLTTNGNFHWLQLANQYDNPGGGVTYNQKPLVTPSVDPPSGGYDPPSPLESSA